MGSLEYNVFDCRFNTRLPIAKTGTEGLNIITPKYVSSSLAADRKSDKTIWVNQTGYIIIYDASYTDTSTFRQSLSGQIAYYELAEEVITDIEIPAELTDWLTVEAGGSGTFNNSDEGKRLLIPNKETFIRNLNEVTV